MTVDVSLSPPHFVEGLLLGTRDLTLADGVDIALNTTTGTKIGTAASQKLGFFGATPVVQRTTVADASVAHALNSTFSDTEVESALNALGTKINSILASLEALGFHASA